MSIYVETAKPPTTSTSSKPPAYESLACFKPGNNATDSLQNFLIYFDKAKQDFRALAEDISLYDTIWTADTYLAGPDNGQFPYEDIDAKLTHLAQDISNLWIEARRLETVSDQGFLVAHVMVVLTRFQSLYWKFHMMETNISGVDSGFASQSEGAGYANLDPFRFLPVIEAVKSEYEMVSLLLSYAVNTNPE